MSSSCVVSAFPLTAWTNGRYWSAHGRVQFRLSLPIHAMARRDIGNPVVRPISCEKTPRGLPAALTMTAFGLSPAGVGVDQGQGGPDGGVG